MRIKNATFRHNQLGTHFSPPLPSPCISSRFLFSFLPFPLFSYSHSANEISQPIIVIARVSNNLMTSCGEHQSVGGAPTDVDF